MQRLWPSDRLLSATEFTQNFSFLLPDHYSIADGALFIILIKPTFYLVVLCLVPNGGICVLTQEQIP